MGESMNEPAHWWLATLGRTIVWARLRVRDNGVGIAEEDLGKVFERFFRTDRARSRDQISGTGLGLSICKAVVETHGGTIHCASQLGKGTTMTVRLPALRR